MSSKYIKAKTFRPLVLLLLPTFLDCFHPMQGEPANALTARPEIELTSELKAHVEVLAARLGERNPDHPDRLDAAARYIESRIPGNGFRYRRQSYRVADRNYANLLYTQPGLRPRCPLLLVGAHYDTARGTPGADDNASGTAVLIELARSLAEKQLQHPLQLAFFTLEEPPHFRGPDMGSVRLAEYHRRAGTRIRLMLSLEMVGFYSSEKIQNYPLALMKLLYPSRGDFIAVIGIRDYDDITRSFYSSLHDRRALPTELLIGLRSMPGLDFSDQLGFWDRDFPALMITDTAFYRNRNYHRRSDLPGTLDYRQMARLTLALIAALQDFDRREASHCP